MSLVKKHLYLTLASMCVAISIIIILQIFWSISRIHETYHSLTEQILNMAEKSAAINLWTFDITTASNLASGIIQLKAIKKISIINADSTEFVSKSKTDMQYFPFPEEIFDESVLYNQRSLYYPVSPTNPENKPEPIGKLILELDSSVLWEDLCGLIWQSLMFLMSLIAIVLIMAAVTAYFFLTKPLLKLVKDISCLHLKPEGEQLLISDKWHKHDEIGMLVKQFNSSFQDLFKVKHKLQRLATFDDIVSLPNRNFLNTELLELIASVDTSLDKITLIFMDIDNFKSVNDSVGHSKGDQVLRAVGARVKKIVGSSGLVCRFSGDSFVALIKENLDAVTSIVIAEQITRETSNVQIDGKKLCISMSIGLASYPTDASNTDELIQYSDAAMYRAKNAGGHSFMVYSSDMSDRIKRNLEITGALLNALQNQEMSLFFQKKINAKSGALVGYEALLRWKRGDEAIMPSEFIRIAESTRQIIPIGRWVLEEAAKKYRFLVDKSKFMVMSISVNLSIAQLSHDDSFVEYASRVLEEYRIPDKHLEFEITESIFAEDQSDIIRKIYQLRRLGYSIAIDDFGTGYSSLSYLTRLPVDTLKIDKVFVEELSRDRTIALAIISFAKILNLSVVAEGVETVEQAEWLSEAGCDYLQGFYIQKNFGLPDL